MTVTVLLYNFINKYLLITSEQGDAVRLTSLPHSRWLNRLRWINSKNETELCFYHPYNKFCPKFFLYKTQIKSWLMFFEIALLPMPWCLALSVSSWGSWILWAPDKISSPLMNISYELEVFWKHKKEFISYLQFHSLQIFTSQLLNFLISKALKKSLFFAKVYAALEQCFCHFSVMAAVFDHGDLFIKLS